MRLVFAGTPSFAARALETLLSAGHDVTLVMTQPDRPAGRGLALVPSAVKQVAERAGLPVAQPPSLRNPEALAVVRRASPQALVVAAYGLILPEEALTIAPLGAFNIHASLLPRWRGAAPIQRAILAGDTQTGISIMQMDAGLDTGPVLSQTAIPIRPDDDSGTLHDALAALGAREIVDALAMLQAGTATARPQPSSGVTYAAKIRKSEAVLDWSKPAVQLERAVRAFRPTPGAITTLDGQPLKIWRARACPDGGSPGKRLATQGLCIACGEGALDILELQMPGGRRLSAAEFLRGHAVSPDTRFG